MKSNNLFIPLLVMAFLSGCGGSGGETGAPSGTSTGTGGTNSNGNTGSTGSGSTGSTGSSITGSGSTGSTGSGSTGSSGSGSTAANVLAITVNGSLCSSSTSSAYPNKPCVSVTVCTPGTSTCQTINDILLDTGSYGLRIFSTALTGVSLTQVSSLNGGALAECVEFGDGSSLWGPVMTADVVLGSETAVQIPIQVVNAGFGTPTGCGTPDASPIAAGFNGILGVGLFPQDCGTDCRDYADNGMYYSVSGSSTVASVAPLSSQVINPVAALPVDNNGVIVQLPTVATVGAASTNGSLILGIGTQTNNTPSLVTMYPSDQSAQFLTTFSGTSYQSFLDTGSNGLYFPSPSSSLLPKCTSKYYSTWFCPSATTSFSAVNAGYSDSPTGSVAFMIGNAGTIFTSSNSVFSDLGGSMAGGFDWGLPFFLGRSVYVGIDGTTSSLGTGPYWAY